MTASQCAQQGCANWISAIISLYLGNFFTIVHQGEIGFEFSHLLHENKPSQALLP